MKVLLAGLALVALVVAAVLILASTKPDAFVVKRTARIAAPPEAVYAQIEDLRRWREWSPYEKLDPDMKRTFSGAAKGVGAVYEWDGNANVGAGRMEIVEATDPSRVGMTLHFLRPFEGHNTATFTTEPDGEGTAVTWEMAGPCTFASKVMMVFIDFDAMIGGQFEEGLADLKRLAERSPASDPSPPAATD